MFTDNQDQVFCTLECMFLVIVAILTAQKSHELAVYMANSMNIPYDFSPTIMSIGFGNEVVILSVVFAIALAVFIIEKAIPTLLSYIF